MKPQTKPTGIVFGALAPKLHHQLTMPPRKLRNCQACADGISLLSIFGILSEAEVRRARLRLLKRIQNVFRADAHES